MEYIIIGIIIVMIFSGAFYLWKNKHIKGTIKNVLLTKQNTEFDVDKSDKDEIQQLMIRLEQIPAEVISDDTKLMEITDSKVLARINDLVPKLFQAGNAAENAIQAVQSNDQVLYQAIIPAGAKLANSRDIAGAVRGLYHGAEGIRGHANFVEVNQNINTVANVVSSAMGVASMIVGQYYMTQINAELGELNAGIKKISNFQDNEYKSKIFSLVTQIQKVVKFQIDILENDDLRLSEIDNLNRWEQKCIELLGQANYTIIEYSNKNDLSYDAYEKQLANAQNWFVYQQTLMEVMIKIAEIKYTLHLGVVSKEQCGALLPIFSKQVQGALDRLGSWHQDHLEKFEISIDKKNRKRIGFDSFIHFIPGVINKNNRTRLITDNTIKKIVAQTNGYVAPRNTDTIDLFQEDVRIILKEDKLYYLPHSF